MQELRQQCSERSPVVAIGKNAGVKMGNHLVRKRDLGLRPLAGPQRDVAARDLRVGALARGHGSDDVDLFVSRAIMGCATLCAVGADTPRRPRNGCAQLAWSCNKTLNGLILQRRRGQVPTRDAMALFC